MPNFFEFNAGQLVVLLILSYLFFYIKQKAKDTATQESIEKLTNAVETVKQDLANQTWITQQVWVEKKKCYDIIFESIHEVKKVLNDISRLYTSLYDENLKKDEADKITKECTEKIKVLRESLTSFTDVVLINAVYLNSDIQPVSKKYALKMNDLYNTEKPLEAKCKDQISLSENLNSTMIEFAKDELTL